MKFPQEPGKRPQLAGDDRTRLLPSVDVSKPYTPPTVPSWDGSGRDATVILSRFHDDPTQVIPKLRPAVPAQDDWHRKSLKKRKRRITPMSLVTHGFAFAVGAFASAWAWWF